MKTILKRLLVLVCIISFSAFSQVVDEDLTPPEFLEVSSDRSCKPEILKKDYRTSCGTKTVSFNTCSPFALSLSTAEDYSLDKHSHTYTRKSRRNELEHTVLFIFLHKIYEMLDYDCRRVMNQLDTGLINLAHFMAIAYYSSNDYYDLNYSLRSVRNKDGSLNQENDKKRLKIKEKLQSYIEVTRDGLNLLPKFEGTVYRDLKLPERIKHHYHVGNIVSLEGFTSTSKLADLSSRVLHTVDKFIIKSISGRDISNISAESFEKEVLFKPDTKFKITKIEDKPKGDDDCFRNFGGKCKVYYLDELPGQ
ncbi:MAG: ADP-ribosyltransferase [Bacteriovoracaceae bacterium]